MDQRLRTSEAEQLLDATLKEYRTLWRENAAAVAELERAMFPYADDPRLPRVLLGKAIGEAIWWAQRIAEGYGLDLVYTPQGPMLATPAEEVLAERDQELLGFSMIPLRSWLTAGQVLTETVPQLPADERGLHAIRAFTAPWRLLPGLISDALKRAVRSEWARLAQAEGIAQVAAWHRSRLDVNRDEVVKTALDAQARDQGTTREGELRQLLLLATWSALPEWSLDQPLDELRTGINREKRALIKELQPDLVRRIRDRQHEEERRKREGRNDPRPPLAPSDASLNAGLESRPYVFVDAAPTLEQQFLAQEEATAAPARLSARQALILELKAQGFKNREIGEKLGISTGTVSATISQAQRKARSTDR